jgi:ferritin
MLKKKIEEYLNRQVDREFYSSNLYLAMASWSENQGFEGISKWLYLQADEERLHMLKIVGFINERGGKAIIPSIKQPPIDYPNVKVMYEQVLEHEEFITASINEIVAVCNEDRDFTTLNWIQWFVNEQIMEEKSVRIILDKIKLMGESNLYLLDKDIIALRAIMSAAEAAV